MSAESNPDRTPGPRPGRHKLGWEAAGAMAGIVGVLVTVLVACSGNSGPASNGPASPSAVPSVTGGGGDIEQNGDGCPIADSTVTVGGDLNCALPRSMAGIDVSYGSVFAAVYAGADARPADPTDFDGYEDAPFCHRWTGWVEKAPDVYLVNPIVNIDIESGRDELEVVTDVRMVIFDRTPIAAGAGVPKVVNCQVGGGHNPGNVVHVDTAVPATTLAANSGEGPGELLDPVPMPPASLTSEDIEHEGASVHVASEDGFYYTGRLEIVTRTNGDKKVSHIGNREQPFRWVSDSIGKYHPTEASEFLSWNANTTEWVVGDDIYDPVGGA